VTHANVDIVRTGIEAFSRGDVEASLAGFHPDIVWEVDPRLVPDAGTYRGHEGVREFWALWHDTFEHFELVIEECSVVDDAHVLVLTHAQGRGAGSGAQVGSRPFAQLYEVRDGLMVHVHMHPSRSGALRAAGLPEKRARA
jgi:uncharacterized protein